MPKESKQEEVKKEESKRFEVVEVPTQTALVIKDNKTDALLEDKQVIAEILNSLEQIKKSVV
jgi:hypothetical protein